MGGALDEEQLGVAGAAGYRLLEESTGHRPGVHPHPTRSLGQLTDTPAIVFGPRLDILEWNPLAARLLRDFASVPEAGRNYARMVFTDPVMREIYSEWEDVARTCREVLKMEAVPTPLIQLSRLSWANCP